MTIRVQHKSPRLTHVPTLEDIQAVHLAIAPYIHRTPVLTSQRINSVAGANVYFKCENFQKIGAFKMRGAMSAGLSLTQEELAKGLATHSSGNHAQAVALTAKNLGTTAYIVMPNNAPNIKKAATKGYGATIIECEPTQQARERTLQEVVERTGATFIHPYDNYNVIAGQATVAKELIEEVSDLQVIMSPVGGGGLMSGTALATTYLLPTAKVIGTEPEAVNDAYRSFKSAALQENTTTNTIADGLKTNLSEKTFSIIRQHVDDVIIVSEAEIVAAMRLVWENMKIIIEPSSAVPLAALLKEKEQFAGQRIGVILTGGNVDIDSLPF